MSDNFGGVEENRQEGGEKGVGQMVLLCNWKWFAVLKKYPSRLPRYPLWSVTPTQALCEWGSVGVVLEYLGDGG